MEYSIVYSDRRTIALSIKDERLIVRAPYGTPMERIEKIVNDHREWIDKHIIMQRNKRQKYGSLTDEKIKELRNLAKRIIPIKVKYFSEIMGVKYGRITITGAQTRFGSCSSKGNLSFSYRLMQYPNEAIDYVVVHELAHLFEMNHSKKFYKIIENVLPDYKERQKMLKK